jgi:RHS repeat-associated protein
VDNQGPEAQTLRNYRTGIAHIDHDGQDWVDEQYYHGDQIDSTRAMTDENHAVSRKFTYTAFGERISTSGTAETRYQYAGGWGYQSHDDFPFLHVGARYYDPESGRFLQRDPIGIAGGVNVYLYVLANPIVAVDPSGLMSRRMAGFVIWVTGGDESWMDDDEKFKAVQDGLTAVGAAGLGLGLGALAPVYATYCAIGYGVGRTSGLSTGNDRADYSLDWIAIGVGIKTLPPWRGPQDPKVGWEVMKGVQF